MVEKNKAEDEADGKHSSLAGIGDIIIDSDKLEDIQLVPTG
jgi:hypothetical protein